MMVLMKIDRTNRTWTKIEAGLYRSNDGVLIESCRHAGHPGSGWFSHYPEEGIPLGWNATLRDAKLDADACEYE